MINFLKRLFSPKSQQSSESKHTAADKFNAKLLAHQQEGVFTVWQETNEIDALSEQIQHLMEVRGKKVQDRADLVVEINKMRSILDLEQIDDEGRLPSQFAEDETIALES